MIVRRRFADDVRRHFAGRVIAREGSLVRADGYTFVFESPRNEYVKRERVRTRIVAIGDVGNIVNILPANTDLERLHYEISARKRLVVTDGNECSLDIQECGANR